MNLLLFLLLQVSWSLGIERSRSSTVSWRGLRCSLSSSRSAPSSATDTPASSSLTSASKRSEPRLSFTVLSLMLTQLPAVSSDQFYCEAAEHAPLFSLSSAAPGVFWDFFFFFRSYQWSKSTKHVANMKATFCGDFCCISQPSSAKLPLPMKVGGCGWKSRKKEVNGPWDKSIIKLLFPKSIIWVLYDSSILKSLYYMFVQSVRPAPRTQNHFNMIKKCISVDLLLFVTRWTWRSRRRWGWSIWMRLTAENTRSSSCLLKNRRKLTGPSVRPSTGTESLCLKLETS